jgi:hypothetical protein
MTLCYAVVKNVSAIVINDLNPGFQWLNSNTRNIFLENASLRDAEPKHSLLRFCL